MESSDCTSENASSVCEEDRVRRLFQACDTNGDGFIDNQDLLAVCKELCLEEYIDELMLELGADAQGRISYEQFLQRRLALRPEIDALKSTKNIDNISDNSQGKVDSWEWDSGARDMSPVPKSLLKKAEKNRVLEEDVKTTKDENLILQWDDNHVSRFSIDWLKERSFREDAQKKYLLEAYRPARIPWSDDTFENAKKTYEYEDIMKNDSTLYNWLFDFARYGMVFIKNAPIDKHIAAKVAKRVAFIKKTHYADEFEIKNTPGTTNVAYLSGMLQLHTDLPYYEYVPGITLLHCLVQTDGDGGDSLLCDGLYHAEKLRKENKEAFDILSSVEVNWLDIGSEHGEKYHSIFRCPVIRLDLHGNVDKIHYSVPQRDSHFTVHINNVKPWYKAMKLFVNSITKGTTKFKLSAGDLMAFDNVRLMHGRLSYKDSEEKKRRLIGVYMDWDDVFSKLRVLKPQN